ncbi:MAG: alkaline phosphatase family protein [Chloroflexota bacterium]
MKILIIGLDGASAELLFGDESLVNIRRLMEWGCYGRLQSVTTPGPVSGWLCLATSRDPSTLGVFDDGSDAENGAVFTGGKLQFPALWDALAVHSKHTTLIGMSSLLPSAIMMTSGGTRNPTTDFLTTVESTHSGAPEKINRPESPERSSTQIYETSRDQFELARQHLQKERWDFLQVVDCGLDRLLHQACHTSSETIQDYFRYLDEQIGGTLELLTEDTVVLIVSVIGAQPVDGSDYTVPTEGCFVLAAPNCSLNGEVQDAHMLDMAPSVLELAGYDIPPTMQGRSIFAGQTNERGVNQALSDDEEDIIRQRLVGLGYIE